MGQSPRRGSIHGLPKTEVSATRFALSSFLSLPLPSIGPKYRTQTTALYWSAENAYSDQYCDVVKKG